MTQSAPLQDVAVWNNEAIIADALSRAPEITHSSARGSMRFSRWRQFVGSYTVPALPAPLFVIQLAGKTDVRYWDRDGWSDATSFPGAASRIPAGRETRWLVDGELDVVTVSVDNIDWQRRSHGHFNVLHFAYSDPLATALAEQMLGELYRETTLQDQTYFESLCSTLSTHISRDRSALGRARYPTSGISSFRVHKVMNAIIANPAGAHGLDQLSDLAGMNKSHLCRVFKQSVGITLHHFLLNVRLERARRLLSCANLTIGNIAEMSGFSGASQFTRAFRQHVKETPSSYRNRALGDGARPQ